MTSAPSPFALDPSLRWSSDPPPLPHPQPHPHPSLSSQRDSSSSLRDKQTLDSRRRRRRGEKEEEEGKEEEGVFARPSSRAPRFDPSLPHSHRSLPSSARSRRHRPLIDHLLGGRNFVPVSALLRGDEAFPRPQPPAVARPPALRSSASAPQLPKSFQPPSQQPPLTLPPQNSSDHPQSHLFHSTPISPVPQRLNKRARKRAKLRPESREDIDDESPSPLPPTTFPSQPTLSLSLSRGASGFGFLLSGERPTLVGSVARGCPAAQAGILPGHVILKVNEVDVTSSSHDFVVSLVGSSDETLSLTVAAPEAVVAATAPVSSTTTTSTTSSWRQREDSSSSDGDYEVFADEIQVLEVIPRPLTPLLPSSQSNHSDRHQRHHSSKAARNMSKASVAHSSRAEENKENFIAPNNQNNNNNNNEDVDELARPPSEIFVPRVKLAKKSSLSSFSSSSSLSRVNDDSNDDRRRLFAAASSSNAPQPPQRSSRPASVQLDWRREDLDLEALAARVPALQQRNSYAGEHAEPKLESLAPLKDSLGSQSSAEDIRRSMTKLYPLLHRRGDGPSTNLQQEQLQRTSPQTLPHPPPHPLVQSDETSQLLRSQSLRSEHRPQQQEQKSQRQFTDRHLDSEMKAETSPTSSTHRLPELRHSPFMRSMSQTQEKGVVESAPFIDDHGAVETKPAPFAQVRRREASDTSVLDSTLKADEESSPEVGRVASWATKFERLLADSVGVAMFRDFLQKEFSDENMRFYLAVDSFRLLPASDLAQEASRVFATFLARDALDCVNVDAAAVARVEAAMASKIEPCLFDDAQAQIVKLMKFDSYTRFLKSNSYKDAVVAEMEGRPVQVPANDDDDNDRGQAPFVGRRSDFFGNASLWRKPGDDESKTRHSLLPWKAKGRETKIPKLSRKSFGKKDLVGRGGGGGGEGGKEERRKAFFSSKSNANLDKKKNVGTTFQNSTFDADITTSIEDLSFNFKRPSSVPRRLEKIRRSLGSSRESLVSSRESVNSNSNKDVGAGKNSSINSSGVGKSSINSSRNSSRSGGKSLTTSTSNEAKVGFRLDLPNLSKSLGIKSRASKPLVEIIDPLLSKYKMCSRIEDVFLYEPSTNAIFTRADYSALTADAFDDRRVVVSIRGAGTTTKKGGDSGGGGSTNKSKHGSAVAKFLPPHSLLSRAASDRYDDQRGPLSAENLEIPDWLRSNADDAGSSTRPAPLRSRQSSASSLSVKSDDDEETPGHSGVQFARELSGPTAVDSPASLFGDIPSPDTAALFFADAMGHANDDGLGKGASKIDLGMNLDSPEFPRLDPTADDSVDYSCLWESAAEFLDDSPRRPLTSYRDLSLMTALSLTSPARDPPHDLTLTSPDRDLALMNDLTLTCGDDADEAMMEPEIPEDDSISVFGVGGHNNNNTLTDVSMLSAVTENSAGVASSSSTMESGSEAEGFEETL